MGCFLPTSSTTQRLFLAQSWCQWNRQTTSVFNRSYVYTRAIFAERAIILPFQEICFTRLTPQSTSLFSQGFVGTRVHCDNPHNQKRHNEVQLFSERSLQSKNSPCCNDNFFVPKDTLQNILLRRCFQMENLISLSISLSQQNENKQRELELPPFWLVRFRPLVKGNEDAGYEGGDSQIAVRGVHTYNFI